MSELKPDPSDEELYLHFVNNLPPELPRELYENGLSCVGFARLIIMELGGPDKAKAIWVRHFANTGHAYVVPKGSPSQDLAYNNNFSKKLTNREVLKRGKDITEDVFKWKWEEI